MENQQFVNRRKTLLAQCEAGSFAVFFAGEAPHKTTDQYYSFTVNKNFFYLTGLNRQQFILLLAKSQDRTFEYLFIEEASDYATKWLGKRLTKAECSAVSGIAETSIFYLDAFDAFLTQNVLTNSRRAIASVPDKIYLDLFRHKPLVKPASLEKMSRWLDLYPELSVLNSALILDQMRLYKDASEIAEIQRAIDIQKEAVHALYRYAGPGQNEHEFEALFEYELKRRGSEGNSFNPIVAHGKNATTLHYEENNQDIVDGSLVLCDMGALSHGYASDITRTFPVSGKFTPRQKQLYQLVLDVNKACIEFVKPGIYMSDLNLYAKRQLAEGAVRIGLIQNVAEIDRYYYHNVSHYLGLDVHDVGSYQGPLKEGVVLTIEPGIYVEEEAIGIRIEDNILVTADGKINLSIAILKEVDDIERYMKR
jgi:Xaa-Pro aminopeptidase